MRKNNGWRYVVSYIVGVACVCALSALVCSQLFTIMYDRELTASAVKMAISVAFFVGVLGYNKKMFLAVGAVAVVFGGIMFWHDHESIMQFLKSFIAWVPNHMFYLDVPYNPSMAPFGQYLISVAIFLCLYFLLMKVRLTKIVCIIGVAAHVTFFELCSLRMYININTEKVLICMVIFLSIMLYFFTAGKKPREDSITARSLPVIAVTLAVCLTLAPVYNMFVRNYAIEETLMSMLNGSGQGGEMSDVLAFELKSGFASSKEKKLGGPLKLDKTYCFIVSHTEPVLIRGAVYDDYTGQTWIRRSRSVFELDNEAHGSRMMVKTTEKYNVPFSIDSEYIQNQYKAGRIFDYTVSDVAVNTKTLFLHINTLKTGFLRKGVPIKATKTGEAFVAEAMERKDEYRVSYVSPDTSSMTFELVLDKHKNSAYSGVDPVYMSTENISNGVRELAYAATKGYEDNWSKANAICEYLRNNYTYTLDTRELTGDYNFVDSFLFGDGQGYCTYFASAMVAMARSVNIPARYVEGYRVDGSGITRVLNANAHAWAECWVPGVGWMSFDPVAASDFAENANATNRPKPTKTPTPTPMEELTPTKTQGADTATPTPVEKHVETLGEGKVKTIITVLAVLLAVAVIVMIKREYVKKLLIRRRRGFDADEQRAIYEELMLMLNKLGIDRKAGVSVREFFHELPNESAKWIDKKKMPEKMYTWMKDSLREYYWVRMKDCGDAMSALFYGGCVADRKQQEAVCAVYEYFAELLKRKMTPPLYYLWFRRAKKQKKD